MAENVYFFRYHWILQRAIILYNKKIAPVSILVFDDQSRHTFGTLLVSSGVPMESIAKMMGHTNIRTTQGYAKVTDDKISEDMDKLIEKK